MARRALAVALGALVLAACRLDVEVGLDVGADGTGQLAVTAEVDDEVVAGAPGLADDLRLADATRAGWVVDGPTAAEEGGLTVTLTHPVSSAAEATNLLASLGPPFADLALVRTTVDEETTNELTGRLTLPGGSFDAFADADLLAAVGGTPFADDLAAAGADPATSMSVTLRVGLPGELDTGTGRSTDEGVEWAAPLDGSTLDVVARTIQRPATGGAWARPLAVLALVALVAWLLASATLGVLVVRARRRRHHQPRFSGR